MKRLLQTLLRITPRQPHDIWNKRTQLRQRQAENLKLTTNLKTDPALLDLSLEELSKRKGQQKFGTFVSRCSDPFHQQLKFLADMNIKKAQEINPQGIPFTVKDHLKVQDMVSTCGYSFNTVPEKQNSEVVDLLIKQGCTPFAHTNVPQGLLNIESGNHVWGISGNPYNKNFISGGSSGGEAVAVATKCSAFGLASDSAGSSRIPAAYCGVVGYKPTGSARLSRKGRLGASGRQTYLFKDLDVSMGFITRSVDDLAWLNQRTLGKSTSYNPYLTGRWDSQKYEKLKQKKIKFGYIIEDHQMKAVPAVRNSILQSIDVLRKNGHQVVQFKFPDLYKFKDFTFKILNVTGAIRGISMFLRGQTQTKQTWWIHERSQYGRLGTRVREFLSTSQKEKQVYKNYNIGNSLMDLISICDQKNVVKAQFLKEWAKSGIEVLITPVTPFTAPLKNSNEFLLNQLTFCGFPNVLQMPSGTVPIRLVKKQETNYEDQGFFESKISNSIKMSQGLPVGIQLSAPYMQDQLCVAAMWQLEHLLPKIPPPTPN